jgi:Na+/melibiose symporter-like transporter
MSQLMILSALDNTRLSALLVFIFGCLLANIGGRSRGVGWLAIIGVLMMVSVVGLVVAGKIA